MEENVKLPEALARDLGNLKVRYLGWVSCDDEPDEEGTRLLCEVVWQGEHYNCPLLLPLQGIVFNEKLTDDCLDLLTEVTHNEVELQWRGSYLEKIERCVHRAAVRLYKRLLKAKQLPDVLRPIKAPAKTRI